MTQGENATHETGTAAERRHAAADLRDEAGRLRDDAAAERDETGLAADARAGDRRVEGDRRDEGAAAGEERAQKLDSEAEGGDSAAEARDDAARLRDQTADADADRLTGPPPIDPAMTLLVEAAHQARVAAADDRAASARDRRAALDERAQAAELRDAAAQDRAAAAADRVASQEDIEASFGHREFSAGDRRDGGEDRRMSGLDRAESAREQQAATLDSLTGVHLRGPGLIELEREIARAARSGEPLTVAFIDVDGLKVVNDTHGHLAGDRLLRTVAETVRAALRPYDLVVRVGGDEFVCALAGLGAKDATARMGAINAALQASPERASVTCGVTAWAPGESVETVLDRADRALYQQRADQRK